MSDKADPIAPKSLADPAELARRRALAEVTPHLTVLRGLAADIAAERQAPVPDPDPLDGGADARVLILLETPGPTIGRTGFVSRDNPTGTAANLFRFSNEAGLARRDTLIWNAIPWVIHADNARNRAPRRSEIRAAIPYLAPLLARLPSLEAVILAGRVAGELMPVLAALRTDIPVLRVPHPSPTYVCTAPDVRRRIVAGLAEAASILTGPDGGGRRLPWDRQGSSLAFGRQTS